ncbi:MAG: dye decolorizing peroxidase [Gaiellales bacterium]|nr:dye decolorizing peroxidase [Gaiellales bacterium]
MKIRVQSGVCLRWSCLVLAALGGLVAPASASAHVKTRTLSTDFEARVGSFRPAAPGLAARVLGGDLQLELRVPAHRVVVVLGLLGEPFLRFSPAGVEANLASPTAGSTGVIHAGDAVTAPGTHWRLIRRGHVLAWHDNRLRPVGFVRAVSPGSRHVVGAWRVDLIVDGRRTTLSGNEWFAPAPSPWPWLAGGTLLVAAAFAAGRRLTVRAQRLLAAALLVTGICALMSAWCGVILADRATLPAELFAGAFACVSGGFLFVGIAAARGARQLGVMALIGAFAATFALPLLTLFAHGFVLSALPGTAARITAAAAVVCGLAAAAVCAPAVRDLLSVEGNGGRRARSLLGN